MRVCFSFTLYFNVLELRECREKFYVSQLSLCKLECTAREMAIVICNEREHMYLVKRILAMLSKNQTHYSLSTEQIEIYLYRRFLKR